MFDFFYNLFSNKKKRNYRKQLNSTIGCYFPAFFEMNLNIYGNMDVNKLKEKQFALFLHEYIHFMQDVSSYYGLSNLFTVNEVIKSMHLNLTTSLPYGGKFKPPVDIMQNNSILMENNQLSTITLGLIDDIPYFDVKKVESKKETVSNNQFVKQIDKVYVTTSKGEYFQFGALAIMENMAYLMEQLCVSECEPSPDYPYSAAEKVANFIAPVFAKDKLMVFALCDVALQASNPGHYFCNTLYLISKGTIQYTKPEDVYDDFYSRMSVTYHSSTIPNYLGQYRQMADAIIDQEKNFIATPKLSVFWEWLENALNYSYDLRLNHRYFLLEIARSGNARMSRVFADYLNAVGSPLMMNKCGNFYCIPSTNVPGNGMCYYRAMRQVYNLLSEGTKKCDMKDWCRQSQIKVDCRCNCKPWEHLKDQDKCPYAVIWGSFNLGNYQPV